MIDDLLDVARIASGKLRLEMQPVDLLAVTLAAVDVIGPSAKVKQIEIRPGSIPGRHASWETSTGSSRSSGTSSRTR